MPPRKQPPKGFDVAEFLGTDTSSGRISFWAVGIVGAGIVSLYGLKCVLTQSAMFLSRRPMGLVEYTGAGAVTLGISYMAVGVYLHCWCCWSEHDKYCGYAEIGKLLSAIVAAAGLLYLVFDMMFLF